MKRILIATKNQGKVEDFYGLFNKYGIEVISLLDLDDPIADIEETGDTFAENAVIKAETIANMKQLPVLADDSGLSIDYLNGRPGVYSARYAGIDKNDQMNNEKVLKELEGVADISRSAQFVCAIALAIPGEETVVKEGFCKGTIASKPRGENGFGYDPIFIPTGYDKTMAQLSRDEKNAISHRGHAIRELMAWLESEKKVGL